MKEFSIPAGEMAEVDGILLAVEQLAVDRPGQEK